MSAAQIVPFKLAAYANISDVSHRPACDAKVCYHMQLYVYADSKLMKHTSVTVRKQPKSDSHIILKGCHMILKGNHVILKGSHMILEESHIMPLVPQTDDIEKLSEPDTTQSNNYCAICDTIHVHVCLYTYTPSICKGQLRSTLYLCRI